MQVLDPTGTLADEPTGQRPSSVDVRGETVGILWNGKPNADNLFRIIEDRLVADYGIAGTIWVDKLTMAHGPAMPATEEMLGKLTSGAIAVLTGSGD